MKYIVDIEDFEPLFKVDSIGVFGIGKSVDDSEEDHSWSRIKSIEDFEELNSDYINEHFGELQDTAYQRGLEEGKQATWGLVADASSAEYEKGLNDAWECARKLFSSMADSDIEKAFPTEWNNGGFHALINLQPQEAIAKLKAYEEKQKADDPIIAGDEVKAEDGTVVFFVTWMSDRCICGVDKEGKCYSYEPKEICGKTGRHFNIILEEKKA